MIFNLNSSWKCLNCPKGQNQKRGDIGNLIRENIFLIFSFLLVFIN